MLFWLAFFFVSVAQAAVVPFDHGLTYSVLHATPSEWKGLYADYDAQAVKPVGLHVVCACKVSSISGAHGSTLFSFRGFVYVDSTKAFETNDAGPQSGNSMYIPSHLRLLVPAANKTITPTVGNAGAEFRFDLAAIGPFVVVVEGWSTTALRLSTDTCHRSPPPSSSPAYVIVSRTLAMLAILPTRTQPGSLGNMHCSSSSSSTTRASRQ